MADSPTAAGEAKLPSENDVNASNKVDSSSLAKKRTIHEVAAGQEAPVPSSTDNEANTAKRLKTSTEELDSAPNNEAHSPDSNIGQTTSDNLSSNDSKKDQDSPAKAETQQTSPSSSSSSSTSSSSSPSGTDKKEKKKFDDWTCVQCGNLNWSFRIVCQRCPQQCPGKEIDPSKKSVAMLPPDANDGDWMCPNCDHHNYAHRFFCQRCRYKHKDPAPPPASELQQGKHPNDWNCPKCGDLNYHFRFRCRRCNGPSPARSSPSSYFGRAWNNNGMRQAGGFRDNDRRGGGRFDPAQNNREGDWYCPRCGKHNFASRDSCRSCATQQPQMPPIGDSSARRAPPHGHAYQAGFQQPDKPAYQSQQQHNSYYNHSQAPQQPRAYTAYQAPLGHYNQGATAYSSYDTTAAQGANWPQQQHQSYTSYNSSSSSNAYSRTGY